jgi:hypothetical protein
MQTITKSRFYFYTLTPTFHTIIGLCQGAGSTKNRNCFSKIKNDFQKVDLIFEKSFLIFEKVDLIFSRK